MTANDRQRVLVILGMHRSGTSLLGGVLQSLGVDFGECLIEGDSHNAGGYFEHATIVRLHQELLRALDRRWTGTKGTLPLPAGWQQRPEVQVIRSQLLNVVADELSRAKGLWGFKDPRVSRFVPLWNDIFGELAVKPLYVLAVRHPLAVAASVIKRDALSPARAQLLWLVHTLEAARDTGAQLSGVVEFDRWFTSPVEQAEFMIDRLKLAQPGTRADLSAVLARHIRPELRHHAGDDQACLPHVTELYRCLVTAAESGRLPAETWQIAEAAQRATELLQAWAEVIEDQPPDLGPKRPVIAPAEPGTRELLVTLAGRIRHRVLSGNRSRS